MPGTEVVQANQLSLGIKVSVITGAQYRYEGTVAAINSIEGTLTLQNVRFWGTENRMPSNGVPKNGESKAPAVGAMFDSITFWISSIVQIWTPDDSKSERSELCDKAVVKVAASSERGRSRRPRAWWYTVDQQRSLKFNPTNNVNHGAAVGRYPSATAQPSVAQQPRMLVTYPRRGRNMGGLQRQASYIPMVPFVSSSNMVRRAAYPSFRVLAPNGSGRKTAHPTRRTQMGDNRRYVSAGIYPRGVFVYLPPEVAYQPRSVSFIHARPGFNRRRVTERSNVPKSSTNVELGFDRTTPYDFEAANAEFAKMTLDGSSVSISQENHSPGRNTREQAASTGDGLGHNISSTTTSTLTGATIKGSGASGDSSSGVVSSTISNSLTETSSGANQTHTGISGPLAKGEYYVREKCFFDQISRSEGPRPTQNTNARNYTNQLNPTTFMPNSAGGMNWGSGPTGSAAARRERQLNLETFGLMAAEPTPRRPTGDVTRDSLVSASA